MSDALCLNINCTTFSSIFEFIMQKICNDNKYESKKCKLKTKKLFHNIFVSKNHFKKAES